ncbi:MAG: hypothetical protein PUJ06_08335, partial [Stecheria intestinalis]|nr:hypothetical protein [Stecheria intestinalis]
SATESIQLITRKNFRKFSMRCRKKKLNDCDTSKFYNKMGHFQKILTLKRKGVKKPGILPEKRPCRWAPRHYGKLPQLDCVYAPIRLELAPQFTAFLHLMKMRSGNLLFSIQRKNQPGKRKEDCGRTIRKLSIS